MFSTILSGAVRGIDSYLMQVETDLSDGLPAFSMVGFLSGEVKEAQERVRVAMRNAGFRIPPARVTISFSPADIPKRGIVTDLPIAVGLLVCMGYLPQRAAEQILFLGELGLDSEVHSVRGVLPIVEEAARQGLRTCILPLPNCAEGAVVPGIKVVGVKNLRQVYEYLRADEAVRDEMIPPTAADPEALLKEAAVSAVRDLQDVYGQESCKRAMEIAAAGFHNRLMVGPPGTGKSMLASCIPGLLPPLSLKESLEITRIYSISGRLPAHQSLITHRPFLTPHHRITTPALTGGGSIPMPGEISLAHRGVLFLDELPEFRRETIDALRQPLEEHVVHIGRLGTSCQYPAHFQLVAAMNPCPCGYFPDRMKCHCTAPMIRRYQSRVSGPVLDRIDLCVEVPRVEADHLVTPTQSESSQHVRARVEAAQQIQKERFAGREISLNAEMSVQDLEQFCRLAGPQKALVKEIIQGLDLSARAYHRGLRVARTIADLEGSEKIGEEHLMEAFSYRLSFRDPADQEAAARTESRVGLQNQKGGRDEHR